MLAMLVLGICVYFVLDYIGIVFGQVQFDFISMIMYTLVVVFLIVFFMNGGLSIWI